MRAIVVKVLYPSNQIGATNPLNRIGSVTETGITCTNFTLDGNKNHFISNLTITYTNQVINRITLISNNGTNLTRGQTVSGS